MFIFILYSSILGDVGLQYGFVGWMNEWIKNKVINERTHNLAILLRMFSETENITTCFQNKIFLFIFFILDHENSEINNAIVC